MQYKDGPNKYGVRKSLFYYSPKDLPDFPYNPALDWRSWTSWNKAASEDIGRGFNYPHVVAAYWAMYRVSREPSRNDAKTPMGLVSGTGVSDDEIPVQPGREREPPRGVRGTWPDGRGYFSSPCSTISRGKAGADKAAVIETLLKERADRWSHEEYPFGSEMAWDSTGQEEVYAECRRFGYDDKALVSLNSVLGYMPTVPHWGYNGNARRYWDFLYGGKLPRIERQIHHYGSGINAIPVLAEYRRNPADFYLLRVGYGGLMGSLTNIDQNGFASAAFHSFPNTLKWDAYSGDYGPNFFGHAFNTGTYIVKHPEFGWQAFGGNAQVNGNTVRVDIRDSLRKRVYLAEYGLWLTLDAGTFAAIEIVPRTSTVRVGLAPATRYAKQARLRVEGLATRRLFLPYPWNEGPKEERGTHVVPLHSGVTWLTLRGLSAE